MLRLRRIWIWSGLGLTTLMLDFECAGWHSDASGSCCGGSNAGIVALFLGVSQANDMV